VGAGHVARCLPLAAALAGLGWEVSFLGDHAGLAGWLLQRAGARVSATDPDAPCGIATDRFDAAVVDSYTLSQESICALAAALPLLTIAESNRCPGRGLLLDYHLDREDRASARLLSGPAFAPLDPALAGAGRSRGRIGAVLVTLGASSEARVLLPEVVALVGRALPHAKVLVAGHERMQLTPERVRAGEDVIPADDFHSQSETKPLGPAATVWLPSPVRLVDLVAEVDVAVTGAGVTAYELACAGVPSVAIAIAANQSRVVEGMRKRNLFPCIDFARGESLAALPTALTALSDPESRMALARRCMSVLDGRGAHRSAVALTELFRTPGAGERYCHRVGWG
jgi:spore coat polysaccharide biosynthesis predicted glycosyltransferase SpsG